MNGIMMAKGVLLAVFGAALLGFDALAASRAGVVGGVRRQSPGPAARL